MPLYGGDRRLKGLYFLKVWDKNAFNWKTSRKCSKCYQLSADRKLRVKVTGWKCKLLQWPSYDSYLKRKVVSFCSNTMQDIRAEITYRETSKIIHFRGCAVTEPNRWVNIAPNSVSCSQSAASVSVLGTTRASRTTGQRILKVLVRAVWFRIHKG